MDTPSGHKYYHSPFLSHEYLRSNLKAIRTVAPQMARRLSWAVDDSHLNLLHSGDNLLVTQINFRGTGYLLNSSDRPNLKAKEATNSFYKENPDKDFLLFGSGSGYYAQAFLDILPSNKTLYIYDRDPLLLRIILMRFDLSKFIMSGRLKLYLGTDIALLRSMRNNLSIFWHPVLSEIYHNERQYFIDTDYKNKGLRILLGEGALFIDDVASTLREMGHDVLPWLPHQLSAEELAFQLKEYAPDLVFQINHLHGLAQFLKQHRIKLISWEIDPVVDCLEDYLAVDSDNFIFTYNQDYLRHYQKAGFENVEYLPLGTNITKRKPVNLTDEEQAEYGASLSFVGASMFDQAEELRRIFNQIPLSFFHGASDLNNSAEIFCGIIAEQDMDQDSYQIPDILGRYLRPGQSPVFQHQDHIYDVAMLLGETAAMRRRFRMIKGLSAFDIQVWGDSGWKTIEQAGIIYRGYAGHNKELNLIYNASLINLDINRFFQNHIITMRVFDAMACEGFILTEHNPALAKLFDTGREIVAYRDTNDLYHLVKYYIQRPQERVIIKKNGREAIIKKHTIRHRLNYMLKTAGF